MIAIRFVEKNLISYSINLLYERIILFNFFKKRKKMKKLSLKVLSVFAFAIIGFGSLITFAQFWGVGGVSDIQGIGGTSTAAVGWSNQIITAIKLVINWALWMLALIALVVLLLGGFQMVTAAGDDGKYKKGFKILQQAAVGLVFIGVSRLMISLIFWLLKTVAGVA